MSDTRADITADIAATVSAAVGEAVAKALGQLQRDGALPVSIADDMLEGADAIAGFLGLSKRQVYHLTSSSRLPVFRLAGTLCARRSVLLDYIARQEAASVAKD